MKQDSDKKFQTHIPEPRWQQIVSVILVIVIVLIWLFLVTRRH